MGTITTKIGTTEKCSIVISKNVTKTVEIPIDSPINGNQKIRDDIKVKGGIVEATVLATNSFNTPAGKVFSSEFTGPYITSSYGIVKEGGESANPNILKTTTILGVM